MKDNISAFKQEYYVDPEFINGWKKGIEQALLELERTKEFYADLYDGDKRIFINKGLDTLKNALLWRIKK